ncbi:hypothetical protein J3L16_05555 [Alteromonas sp. 5E99-2]|uniref:hypothetical protein n=1 Tax=Alteromonas sp. 5E99-2 TaxID=2817683 RepID=UPI001A9925F5|nr:hypothetical protein [Alteromonas sp. 5E99-2]MBO1255153.1 hypothetical protein [Alteromonas sp. 5E99-2]
MQVNGAQYYSSQIDVVQKGNLSPKSTVPSTLSTPATTKSTADTVSISTAGLSAEQRWQEIADKYDLTNVTANEVTTMAKELYDNKLISATEMFDMYVPEDINFHLNLDTKRDHIENMTNRLTGLNNAEGISRESIEQATKILEMLKDLG